MAGIQLAAKRIFTDAEQVLIIKALLHWLWDEAKAEPDLTVSTLVSLPQDLSERMEQALASEAFERKSCQQIKDSLVLWIATANEASAKFPTLQSVIACLPMSALFRRLLSGLDPLPVPPPTSFGTPWYDLADQKMAKGKMEFFQAPPASDSRRTKPILVLNQYPWRIAQQLDDKNYLISYRNDAPWYQLSVLQESETSWAECEIHQVSEDIKQEKLAQIRNRTL